MKIIKNNCYNNMENIEKNNNIVYKSVELKPFTFICDECNSEVDIETENDLETLNGEFEQYGLLYVDCPCCGKRTCTEEVQEITLNTFHYPQHFTDRKEHYIKHIEDEAVEESIRKCINELKLNHDEYVTYTYYGDVFILVHRLEDDGEYYVAVSRNTNDCYIKFDDNEYVD